MQPSLQDSHNVLTSNTFSKNEVIAHARESLDFLAALSIPHVYKYAFPLTYISIWAWLRENMSKRRDFSQLALGMPRGFSKTLIAKLAILYAILFTQKEFILVVCESLPKAKNIIADVMGFLKERNIISIFGDYRANTEIDRQELQQFKFLGRTIIIGGVGSGGDPRGLNIDNKRPDFILFDDIQSREVADSEVLSMALERWMVGTVMKTKSPEGCLFLFLANMYPTKFSLLRRLKSNENWVKFIVGGILVDGSSLWEELHPIKQLLKEYSNDLASGHPEIFYAEVLNDEYASSNHLIDVSKIPYLENLEQEIHTGNFIVIDPSTNKQHSDEIAIGYFEVYDAKPVLIHVEHERMSPGEMIRRALKLALKYNCKLVVTESVAYQATANYWFGFICQQYNITGIHFQEIYPGGSSKGTRIMQMFQSLLKGELYFHGQAKSHVLSEIVAYNPLRHDNTDNILDLLTYAPRVLVEHPHLVILGAEFNEYEYEEIETPSIESLSPF